MVHPISLSYVAMKPLLLLDMNPIMYMNWIYKGGS